jgi:hypothetical protein
VLNLLSFVEHLSSNISYLVVNNLYGVIQQEIGILFVGIVLLDLECFVVAIDQQSNRVSAIGA